MNARRLAWGMWGLAMVLVLPGPVLQSVVEWTGPADVPFMLGFIGAQVCAASAGFVVALRQPGHAVGWIFLAMGLGIGVAAATGAYAELGVDTSHGPLPADTLAAWLSAWTWIPVLFALPMFLLFLFPTGRFLSRRWELAGWLVGGIVAVGTVASALKPGPLESQQTIENPLGLSGAAGDVVDALDTALTVAAFPGFALAVAALAVRFRRSRGVERQQLRWFTYASGLVGLGFTGSILTGGWIADALFLIGLLALCGLPIAAGIAILRYRLYDLDLVVRRTLVYAGLSAALVASYLGLVLLLQQVLSPGSDFAIAGSTLAVAALFRPLRARIQAIVDQRFYRSHYDAERTLEGFGARLRDEIDLDALGSELRTVAADTMQPAHVSLWLRSPG